MGWRDAKFYDGKSYYEKTVEEALIALAPRHRICRDYRFDRATWFSGPLRYDFQLGLEDYGSSLYLIEVQGEQHYRWDFESNDILKERLAREHGSPLLVLGWRDCCRCDEKLKRTIRQFLVRGRLEIRAFEEERAARMKPVFDKLLASLQSQKR